MKEFLLRPKIQAITAGILTTVVSISLAVLGDWDPCQKYFVVKLLFFLLLSSFDIIFLAICAAQQVKDKLLLSEYRKQLTAYETALSGIIWVSQNNASKLNSCIHDFKSTQKLSSNIWTYKNACYDLCRIIYTFACKLSDSPDCEIAYVRLNENIDGEISMFAYANRNNQKPNLLNVVRNFKNKGASQIQYYDMAIFDECINETKVLYGSDTINRYFYRTPAGRERDPNKYNQFISIPVFCDNQKMVGLLEIACLHQCTLGKNADELKDISNRYFVPYSNLFLMIHKIEKALYLGL